MSNFDPCPASLLSFKDVPFVPFVYEDTEPSERSLWSWLEKRELIIFEERSTIEPTWTLYRQH